MIKLSRTTDYGIVLMAHLAESGVGAQHNAREVAERFVAVIPLYGLSEDNASLLLAFQSYFMTGPDRICQPLPRPIP